MLYTYQVTPQNSRPIINGVNISDYTYVYGKPQPIKHWRKQYDTSNCTVKIETFKNDICNGTNCVGKKNKIKRSGTTNLNKSYYTSTSSYLQSRTKTFNQNQTLGENTKDYTYASTTDASGCVIYKPSNLAFKTQGAVSASLTTLKNRNSEITKNTNSFRTPYGLSGANFGQYHGSSPYFVKNKTNICNDCTYLGYTKPMVRID